MNISYTTMAQSVQFRLLTINSSLTIIHTTPRIAFIHSIQTRMWLDRNYAFGQRARDMRRISEARPKSGKSPICAIIFEVAMSYETREAK